MKQEPEEKPITNAISKNSPKRRAKRRGSSKKISEETTPKEIVPTVRPAEPKPEPIDVDKARKVIFQPNPGPQEDFLSASEQEVLYGGSAGGGKSYAMTADPVRGFNNPHFRGILFRRTNDELRELKSVSKQLYPKAIKGARWSEKESQWNFPSGATLWMTYLDKDDDVMRYQGQAYNWIGFDELTQWPTPHAWDYLRSRLRTTTASGLDLYMRATTNPGGPGHHWVKKMFIDPAPYGKAFDATDIETGKRIVWPKGSAKAGQSLFQRRFIPASLKDNPYLFEDGMYEANLLSLPEHQRKRLLEGDWDVAEGAAFTEFSRQDHVVEPFDIPNNWLKFRACDYGYGSYSSVLWLAVAPNGQVYVYDELYVSKVLAVDLADMVLERQIKKGYGVKYGVLDSNAWHQRGDNSPSIADQMRNRGCSWRPADKGKGSRISGKNTVHRFLKKDEFLEKPLLQFFNNCVNIIAHLPSIPLDKNNPEDVDTNFVHDHTYDALRYGLASLPRVNFFYDDLAQIQTRSYRPADTILGY